MLEPMWPKCIREGNGNSNSNVSSSTFIISVMFETFFIEMTLKLKKGMFAGILDLTVTTLFITLHHLAYTPLPKFRFLSSSL